jgi:UDP-glucose 4-epimerase
MPVDVRGNVLVTGGLGYIGSHAVQRLLRDGHDVTIIDNLFRGHRQVAQLLASPRLHVVEGDVADRALVRGAIVRYRVNMVMHFAALAYVGESVDAPLTYYRNNISGLIELLTAMDEARRSHGINVSRLVFSSTCAVYGDTAASDMPLAEGTLLAPVSPYGRSKLMCEQIVRDEAARLAAANVPFAAAMLRYFNVCGSDRSGVLGEDHRPETHLIPIVLEVAKGKRERLTVFGDDYPTSDGTCIRDYIHVEDLVDAHVRVMAALQDGEQRTYNVGTGRGASVREVIAAAESATGAKVAFAIVPRRAGDAASAVADPAKIMRELGWKPQVPGLRDMIASAWAWMKQHPGGYGS